MQTVGPSQHGYGKQQKTLIMPIKPFVSIIKGIAKKALHKYVADEISLLVYRANLSFSDEQMS